MPGRIYKRSRGSYTVVVDLGRDPVSGKRRQHSKSIRGPKSRAESYLRNVLNGLDENVEPRSGTVTLAEYLRVWLDTVVAVRYRDTSAVTARRNVRLYINPYLGQCQLRHLSADRVQAWVAKLKKQGGSGGTPLSGAAVHRIFNDLHSALQNAVDKKKLRSHPMSGVKPPEAAAPNIQAWRRDEAKALVDAAATHRNGAIVRLALDTGMRRSELLGLRWSDVDISEGATATIMVQQTAHRADGRWVYGPPKTDRSRRTIPIGQRAASAVSAWKSELATRHAGKLPELVFPGPTGAPLSYSVLRKTLSALRQAAGVPAYSFHALRHTHATLLLLAGVHAQIVCDRLGHHSVAFTLRTYVHFLPSMQLEAAFVIDEVLEIVAAHREDAKDLPET